MASYDDFDENNEGPINGSRENRDVDKLIDAFRQSCGLGEKEKALSYALEIYFMGGVYRENIVIEAFYTAIRDVGISNAELFPQIYQLLVPIITRYEELDHEKEEVPVEIDGHEGYFVTSHGRILNDHTSEIVKLDNSGTNTMVEIEGVRYRVENLVAEHFLKKKSKEHIFIKHRNKDKHDNRSENLAYMKSEKEKPKPGWEISIKPFVLFAEDDVISKEDDKSSYIWRFASAIWLIASSPKSKLNGSAMDVFDIDKSEDNDEKYLEKYGTLDENKTLLKKSFVQKNIADCLYYSKVIFGFKGQLRRKLPWTKSKETVVQIWDVFKTETVNAPEHVGYYLKLLHRIALHDYFVEDERSKLFYIHFIHMWCLDPITAHIKFNKGGQVNKLKTPWGAIGGVFTRDFIERVSEVIPGQEGRFKKRKHTYHAKIDELEPIIFPIEIVKKIIDPKEANVPFVYTDVIDGEVLEFPDFNEHFEDVIQGNVPDLPEEDENMELFGTTLEDEEEFYTPFDMFYIYFANINDNEVLEIINEEKKDTIQEYFDSVDYPNPFIQGADLSETEYLSFGPHIAKALKFCDVGKNYCEVTPSLRKQRSNMSTLRFRTVSSPRPKPRSPTVVQTPRKRPSTPILERKKSNVATARKLISRTVTPIPRRKPKPRPRSIKVSIGGKKV
jgi:hypothetical protein